MIRSRLARRIAHLLGLPTTTFACDYSHYDHNGDEGAEPADYWAWGADGRWYPVCAADLPYWWDAEKWGLTDAPPNLPKRWYVSITTMPPGPIVDRAERIIA